MSTPFKANVGGNNYKKKNHYKLKDGDVVFRIIPPIGKLENDGKGWIRYHSVHFGYKNTEGKLRTFESTLKKDFDTKTIKVPDAALDRLNDLKEKLEKARADGDGPLMAKLNTLVGFKGVYSVDNNFHMNVIGLDGQIGELKIRKKAKVDLEREIKRLEAEGTYPLSEEDGRFFVFHRDGMSLDTNFKVSVYTVKVPTASGKMANEEVSHRITPEIKARFKTEAFDLDDLFNKVTHEEVAQIVAESDLLSGKSPAIDRILDARWKAKKPTTGGQDSTTSDDGPDDDAPVQTAPKAPAAQTPATVAKTTPPTQTQAQAVEEMSDEDFFKTLGVQTA
jgi:hypothetical protein